MSAASQALDERTARPMVFVIAAAGALVVGAAVGAVYGERPIAAYALLAYLWGVTAFALTFRYPRWSLIAVLVLFITYAADVLGSHVGGLITPFMFVTIVLLAVIARRLLGLDSYQIPPVEFLLLLLFGLAMGVSLLAAADYGAGQAWLFEFWKSVSVVFLMLVLFDNVDWLRRSMWALAVGGAILGALTVLQQATQTYDSDYGGFAIVNSDRGLSRSAGPIDANFFGQLMVFTSTLSLYLILATERSLGRAIALASFGLGLFAIWFSLSRASLITMVLVLSAVVIFRRIPFKVAAAALVIGAILIAFFASEAPKKYVSALTQPITSGPGNADDRSLVERYQAILVGVDMFRDNPLIGVGPSNYPAHYLEYAQSTGVLSGVMPKAIQPHNLYLEMLAEVGVVGTAVLFTLVGIALTGSWRARRHLSGANELFAEAAFVALGSFLVNSLFLHAAYPRQLWIPVGLALVARRVGIAAAARSLRGEHKLATASLRLSPAPS
jgi:putative inorganic carbon (HCO3(-)) transporter